MNSHAGQKGRDEGEHAMRRGFVVAIAETVKARRSPSQIDDNEEERRQRVQPEMGAEPRQSDRQGQFGGIGEPAEQPAQRADQGEQ